VPNDCQGYAKKDRHDTNEKNGQANPFSSQGRSCGAQRIDEENRYQQDHDCQCFLRN